MQSTPVNVEVEWFPNIAAGLARPTEPHLRSLITLAWKLAIDGRALIEDMEGALDEPQLMAVLKFKYLELLLDLDLDLGGFSPLGEEHLLPLALERGLCEVARCDGSALAERVLGDPQSTSATSVMSNWNGLLAAFPGEIPNPLLADGQGPLLRSLRNWSKLCRQCGIDEQFLTPLIKAI
jgi:hypothetical protein